MTKKKSRHRNVSNMLRPHKKWSSNLKTGIRLWKPWPWPLCCTEMKQPLFILVEVQDWTHSLSTCWVPESLGQRWARVSLPYHPKFKASGADIIKLSNHSISRAKSHRLFSEEKSTAADLAADFWSFLLPCFPLLSPVLAPQLDYKFLVNYAMFIQLLISMTR